ncbi:hypothetical protein VKA52_13650 [Halobacillus sp. HZG1]|uniref:hypothetical protein n=1 Tax=Halobacillus sp. HZG1 TaxID=3111769 RepID=UPI002DBAC40E|nr:hypothetical protein [Halobacillus sp. HZG1]MEC3884773.1 hypothetical protein [Halobacillus sp. HZG1]
MNKRSYDDINPLIPMQRIAIYSQALHELLSSSPPGYKSSPYRSPPSMGDLFSVTIISKYSEENNELEKGFIPCSSQLIQIKVQPQVFCNFSGMCLAGRSFKSL